jgi:hypothetical protein
MTDLIATGRIMKLTLAGDDILVLSDPADAQELVRVLRPRLYLLTGRS